MNRRALPILFILGILASLVPAAVSENRVSTGTIVYNYVGRIYIDPATGTGQVAGYFPSIASIGIDKAFQGTPTEATAFFTYRSEPLRFTNLPSDGDTAITLLDAGKWHIYFNPNPASNWNEPSSFSQGQLIADLTHNALAIVSTGQAHQAVFSGELLAGYDFVFNGKNLNLADFFPDGITNFSSATNTVVRGPSDFPVTFPDAGWAVAKGRTHDN